MLLTDKPDVSCRPAEHPAPVEQKSVLSVADAFGALASFAAVIVLFYKTVFFAAPIARMYQLANLDAFFRDQFNGAAFAYDCTMYLLKPGLYHLVASVWRSGNIPLWNPNSGCGVPLIGDLQSQTFSPWLLLYTAFPTDYLYNLLPVLQLATSAVGVYFLARELNLARLYSFYAAVTATLCPYFIHQVELTGGPANCLLPFVAWLMVRVERAPSVLRAIAAGALCALTIMCGHSEASFFVITTASFLMVSLFVANPKHGASLLVRFAQSLKYLSVAAVTAFCLSAPVLFPFIEYILNCDCYKFHPYWSEGGGQVPWQGLLLSFFHPVYGGKSPFYGLFAIPFIVAACLAFKKRPTLVLPLVATSFFVCDSAARLLFIPLIDKVTGLYHLSRNEALPEVMVPVALLIAIGAEEIVGIVRTAKPKLLCMYGGLTVSLLALIFTMRKSFDSWSGVDLEWPEYAVKFHQSEWVRDIILFAVVVASVVAIRRFRNLPAASAALLLIGVSLFSQLSVSRHSMPVVPKFSFPKIAMFDDLKRSGERASNVGCNIFQANVNLVYDIPSVALHSPVSPQRYNQFMSAAGGRADGFNAYFESPTIGRLADLASVRYFLSLLPVKDPGDSHSPRECLKKPVEFFDANSLRLNSARLHYDPVRHQIVGDLSWTVKRELGENYYCNFVVGDKSGKPYWFGAGDSIRPRIPGGDFPPGNVSKREVQMLVPKDVPVGTDLVVGIQILDRQSSQLLTAKNSEMLDHVVVLSHIRKQSAEDKDHNRFALVSELKPHFIRVYENRFALPQALLVHDAVQVEDGKSALAAIKSPTFDPSRSAVVESKVSFELADLPVNRAESALVTRPSTNQVNVTLKAITPGLLVLSDVYFPGWIAELDGKPVKILRANYLFRGVEIPAGAHTVVFKYAPVSFWSGVILAALFSAFSLGLLLVMRRRNNAI